MDKEKEVSVDFTGYSEKKLAKATDMVPGQWKNVSRTPVFKKKPIEKKKLRK
ncbi:MAG TPA: hypothetical protein VNA13_01595 [Xanthomonadales bacterium]|nr:hypothetical protein [Xanthomonadales bacterium]